MQRFYSSCVALTVMLTLSAMAANAPESRAPAATEPARRSGPTTHRKKVEAFALSQTKLLDGPFKAAMERNAAYLLSLEPDRLLHNVRKYAGLQQKGEVYGGWESTGLAGHTLGHYLTALSLQYAATNDPRFRQRIDYLISEMAECQKSNGDGYVGALPGKELGVLRGLRGGTVELAGAFNFKGGAWAPWYTQHKVLQGLVDAWTLGGNTRAKDVALKLADWTDDVTKNLSPDQQQKMLQVEHGGMLETLVQIYALTGEKRYLDVSRRFYHKAIFDPLLAGKDELDGKHANTQIPKITGAARMYEATGDRAGRTIAENFWNIVVRRRTWVMGGNSDREHFFPVGKAHEHLGPAAAETCNTYNMLKLTEHLIELDPTVEKADYYERALYNHILASQEPRRGMFTYFVSLKPGHFKTYSRPFESFWCCVGTGMENHTKYGEAIYFHSGDELYVNLFIPSVLTWEEKGLSLEQRTKYPEENASEITIHEAPKAPLTLRVRCPGWASGTPTFQLNGEPLDVKAEAGKYAEIARTWNKGDRLRVTIPMGLRVETLEDNANKVAFFYGPLLLAGDLGPVPGDESLLYRKDQGENFRAAVADVPVLVRSGTNLIEAVKRIPGEDLAFRTGSLGKPNDVTLRPLNRIFYERYNVYWEVLTPQEFSTREADLAAETSGGGPRRRGWSTS